MSDRSAESLVEGVGPDAHNKKQLASHASEPVTGSMPDLPRIRVSHVERFMALLQSHSACLLSTVLLTSGSIGRQQLRLCSLLRNLRGARGSGNHGGAQVLQVMREARWPRCCCVHHVITKFLTVTDKEVLKGLKRLQNVKLSRWC